MVAPLAPQPQHLTLSATLPHTLTPTIIMEVLARTKCVLHLQPDSQLLALTLQLFQLQDQCLGHAWLLQAASPPLYTPVSFVVSGLCVDVTVLCSMYM